ncbi:MAG: site-specific DNA-methyltransferase [Actinomycetota bacterium]|nr:site-specific DNA-methyltransferase [Actinomycetota bacterium]
MPPKPAKNPREHLQEGPTNHRIILGDCRQMPELSDQSVHLVVTSPPYFNLKEYEPGNPSQLGDIDEYEKFLDELDKVWEECFRVLVPGGRVCCVVGDVNVARRNGGRHFLFPLSSDIRVRARRLGFDNLQGVIWYKVANIQLEASRSTRFLGKPNLPGGVIKNDTEHILFFRKPGYRSPSGEMEEASFIPSEDYFKWFRTIWDDIRGASLRDHPAPFPVEISNRLIRMFSFVGDRVLDPFIGTGSTVVSAIANGRSSIGYEVEPLYFEQVRGRLSQMELLRSVDVDFIERPS